MGCLGGGVRSKEAKPCTIRVVRGYWRGGGRSKEAKSCTIRVVKSVVIRFVSFEGEKEKMLITKAGCLGVTLDQKLAPESHFTCMFTGFSCSSLI